MKIGYKIGILSLLILSIGSYAFASGFGERSKNEGNKSVSKEMVSKVNSSKVKDAEKHVDVETSATSMGDENGEKSRVTDSLQSSSSINQVAITKEEAIELFKKTFSVNPELSQNINWNNYDDSLWNVTEIGNDFILLHWTNIGGAGGSYYKFKSMDNGCVLITTYDGNASYPDNPTLNIVVDKVTGKMLNK